MSTVRIPVIEIAILDDILCSSSAHLHANFTWKVGDRFIARGPEVSFDSSLSISMGGNYTCVVMNRHRAGRTTDSITVLHKPLLKVQFSFFFTCSCIFCNFSIMSFWVRKKLWNFSKVKYWFIFDFKISKDSTFQKKIKKNHLKSERCFLYNIWYALKF